MNYNTGQQVYVPIKWQVYTICVYNTFPLTLPERNFFYPERTLLIKRQQIVHADLVQKKDFGGVYPPQDRCVLLIPIRWIKEPQHILLVLYIFLSSFKSKDENKSDS